ncbi:MAG: hypothetical protein LBJ64_01920 [Deltaproteobacteria bacterium]|jgi:hypothetical protein|nr:hypothetical protein [Deltaproteobacteria bacterium]
MNDILAAMSADMHIDRIQGETLDDFAYRLCYSALGQWCLHLARSSEGGVAGTSKHTQTAALNELILRYAETFPTLADRFVQPKSSRPNLAVHVRKAYEETGYLLVDENNRIRLANYGRTLSMGDSALFFGLPEADYAVNGLGAFVRSAGRDISTRDFLIRDDLSWEQYFQSQFDIIDFYDREIDIGELVFFDPLSKSPPSQSWCRTLTTDCTLARNGKLALFYRVMRLPNGSLQFSDEMTELQNDSFTSYEYRRLYFALKAHYKTPHKAIVSRNDSSHSTIRLDVHLPNREYFYFLLISWPITNAFNKVNFLFKSDFIFYVCRALSNLGIEVYEGGQKCIV